MDHFLITGALQPPRSDVDVPPERREINAFIRGDPDHQYEFDLFVQALCKLMLQSIHASINCILADIQESNIKDPDSYYQMCGIHEVLWLPANRLRLPYWDWGVNAVPPPEIIELPKLEVLQPPSGRPGRVPNPFLAYTFPLEFFAQPAESFAEQPALACGRKLYGARPHPSLPESFSMLTRKTTWKEFSNRSIGTGVGRPTVSNLSMIISTLKLVPNPLQLDWRRPGHGPGGHMRQPRASAFDPIFWLHHAYVDRLLALWSAMNPDAWVTPGPAIDGTFTIPWAKTLTVDTDLTPFWRDQKKYWSSADVKTTAVFNYRYTDFDNLDMTDRETVYSVSPARDPARCHHIEGQSLVRFTRSRGLPPIRDTVNNEQSRDWTARIQVEKYALNGSFSTYIFLGPVPSDSSEWYSSPSFVGSDSVFSDHQALGVQSDGVGHCANCQQQAAARVVVEGFVHLNTALARRIADPDENITSFDPVDVVPYLKEHLSWRVLSGHNAPIAAAGIPSLDVQVSATPMWIRHGDKIRSYGQPEFFPEVTEGRNA
ncbi:hypothetical protein B0H13DRAFT_1895798 [Mycena leptocephala]|nr:hypothetical protein B0H13DRAFT_1895798 [Mycena leptocephala]